MNQTEGPEGPPHVITDVEPRGCSSNQVNGAHEASEADDVQEHSDDVSLMARDSTKAVSRASSNADEHVEKVEPPVVAAVTMLFVLGPRSWGLRQCFSGRRRAFRHYKPLCLLSDNNRK